MPSGPLTVKAGDRKKTQHTPLGFFGVNPDEQPGLGATACCYLDSIVLHKEPSKKHERVRGGEGNKGSTQDLI